MGDYWLLTPYFLLLTARCLSLLFLCNKPFDLGNGLGHWNGLGANVCTPPHALAPPGTVFIVKLSQPPSCGSIAGISHIPKTSQQSRRTEILVV